MCESIVALEARIRDLSITISCEYGILCVFE